MRGLAPCLLLVAALRGAHASCSDPSSWSAFQVHVIAPPGDATAIAAQEALKRAFCVEFSVSPCEVTNDISSDAVTIFEQLGFHLPRDLVADVLPWLLQQRWSWVSGQADLDLLVHPVTDCGTAVDFANHSLNVGTRFPWSPNSLYETAGQSSALASPLGWPPAADALWAAECSSDCTDICVEPFANNTSCSAASAVTAFHVHFFYYQNNNNSVYGKEALFDALVDEFDLSDEVCSDTEGHEQAHNHTCKLVGPDGEWTVLAYSQESAGSSFVYGTSSLYVMREDFTDLLSWLLWAKNGQFGDGTNFDFLMHPLSGCNFADHVEWSLHASSDDNLDVPNNMWGVAEEGGWQDEVTASPLDKASAAYVNSLGDFDAQDPADSVDTFNLHVLYDSSNADAVADKDCFVAALKEAGAWLAQDLPQAWTDPGNPFLLGEAELGLTSSALVDVLDVAMTSRPNLVDVLLAPSAGSPLLDYLSSSLYIGYQWKLSVAQLLVAPSDMAFPTSRSASFAILVDQDAAAAAQSACTLRAASSASAYILYVMHAANNAYQAAAWESFLGNFSAAFGVERSACTGQYPAPEPAYGETLCMMQEVATPFELATEVQTTSYAAVFVPASKLPSALVWAMIHRGATIHGYDIDLQLVPLTGSALEDYSSFSLRAGVEWRVNPTALV